LQNVIVADLSQVNVTTPICPACGCSLVRLGINKQESVTYGYNGKDYNFCCDGCVKIFVDDPEKYLLEINNITVCPTCLAEKPIQSTVKLNYDVKDFHFCRCPHCIEEFKKNPEYFIKRLSGM
jgi:YHS domain-containing protein